MRIYFIIILALLGIDNISSQNIERKTIQIDGAITTNITQIEVFDDEILMSAWNFYIDSSQYFFCKLDTNLNVLRYVDLATIDEDIVSGPTAILKTQDDGYLLGKQTANGKADYMLIKFDEDLNEVWHHSFYDSSYLFRPTQFLFETDSAYYVFGNVQYPDFTQAIFRDKISKEGELLEHKIIFESVASAYLNSVKIIDNDFYLGINYSVEFNPTPLSRYLKIQQYDKDLNLLNEWNDRGDGANIHMDGNGGIYFTTRYIWEPELAVTLPRHLVRKLNNDFSEAWTQDYLYPPFAFYEVGQQVFMYNVVHFMFPDPRGGYYVVGELLGTAQQMEYIQWSHNNQIPGSSLFKIDQEGEMQWKYMDSFNYITPKYAGQLSSGSLIILGEGQIPDFVHQTFRNRLTMIKTDADACVVPGCRISSTKGFSNDQKAIIYPNPSRLGIYNVDVPLHRDNSIVIYNQMGQIVYRSDLSTQLTSIDLSSEPDGIYYYSILGSQGVLFSGKLVKL